MIEYTLILIIVLISICELIGQSCLKYLNIHDSQYQYYLFKGEYGSYSYY